MVLWQKESFSFSHTLSVCFVNKPLATKGPLELIECKATPPHTSEASTKAPTMGPNPKKSVEHRKSNKSNKDKSTKHFEATPQTKGAQSPAPSLRLRRRLGNRNAKPNRLACGERAGKSSAGHGSIRISVETTPAAPRNTSHCPFWGLPPKVLVSSSQLHIFGRGIQRTLLFPSERKLYSGRQLP